MPENFLTSTQVAKLLGLSRQTIYRRYKKGRTPPPDARTASGAPLWSPERIAEFEAAR